MQRRLIMLFCHRCKCDGLVTFREQEAAFHWRITPEEMQRTKEAFIQQGFIDEEWNLLNWNDRQYLSDSSTDRTRAYRERMRTSRERHGDGAERSVTVDVTVQDTEADTEAEQYKPSAFVDSWNRLSDKLPKIERFTDGRRKKLATRIRQGLTIERFETAVACCTRKGFLLGDNDRGWTATFDWLIDNQENVEKAISNPYTGSKQNGGFSNTPSNSPSQQKIEYDRKLAQVMAERAACK